MTTAVVDNAHGDLDTYYQRMSSSLGDKKSVLPYITGRKVLDVGCGSGDLTGFLLTQGFDAYGLDASPESVQRAAATVGHERVVLGYADQIAEKFGENAFDTIVCCSIFHEVFSYGNERDERGRISSLSHTLDAIRKALRPGGRLVVRDGVMPTNNVTAQMWVDKPEEVTFFMAASPFTRGVTDREVILTQIAPNVFEGSMSSAMEFAFTYTWGPDSFEREVQEFYGVFNLDDYARFVESHGFVNVERFEYIQPGYMTHLEGKVRFSEAFPATNAIWIYDKS